MEFRERNSDTWHIHWLSGKHFSAFSSSGSKHLSSVGSAHSCSEAMNLGSGSLLRLECHLHAKHLLVTRHAVIHTYVILYSISSIIVTDLPSVK